MIDRLRAFADGHYLIKKFSHGQIDLRYLEQDADYYPWMHVIPGTITPREGLREYSFDITFSDLTRDKEHEAEYIREAISDCTRLAEDLLAEIKNGNTLFDPLVQSVDGSTITPFIHEDTHTLTGVTLSLSIRVPWNWSACDIPADYAPGGSGSGGEAIGGCCVTLQVGGIDNVNQSLLNLIAGTNMTITDNGDGSVTFDSTGGISSVSWGSILGTLSNQTDLQNALDLKADISSLSAVATSGDYNDLSNLPTIPDITGLVPYSGATSDVNLGVHVITMNDGAYDSEMSPQFFGVENNGGTIFGELTYNSLQITDNTIPSTMQITATGISFPDATIQTTAAVAQVNSDWNAVSGVAEILNKPTIPTSLPPSGAAGGDLSGTYPNPNVDRIHGVDMQSGTPSTDEVWVYGGSPAKWQHQHLGADQVNNTSGVTGSSVKDALDHLDSTKEPSITAGTTSQYWRGDKSWQTLNKSAVGLSNVDNTSDANKPISTATQTALNAKQDTLVSGTNIKTVNSTSLVGSGNVSVGTVTSVSGTGTTAGLSLSGSVTSSGSLTLSGTLSTPVNTISDSTTVGQSLVTLTNPSAIRYLRINANNTVTAITAATLLSELGIPSGTQFRLTKTADQTITASTTTASDITDLTFPITSGKKYKFTAYIIHTASLSTVSTRLGINANVAVSYVGFQGLQASSTTTLFSMTLNSLGTVTNSQSSPTSPSLTVINGYLDANNTGTAAMQFAKQTAVATTITVKAGSFVEYTEF